MYFQNPFFLKYYPQYLVCLVPNSTIRFWFSKWPFTIKCLDGLVVEYSDTARNLVFIQALEEPFFLLGLSWLDHFHTPVSNTTEKKILKNIIFTTILSSQNSSPFCQFLDGCYCKLLGKAHGGCSAIPSVCHPFIYVQISHITCQSAAIVDTIWSCLFALISSWLSTRSASTIALFFLLFISPLLFHFQFFPVRFSL